MATEVAKELAALPRIGVAALREKYAEVVGEATTTGDARAATVGLALYGCL